MRPAKDHRPLLLQTAARLFAEKQFHEVLMEDVAIQSGVAKGTVYRFFRTKEALYSAVCMEFLDDLNRQLDDVVREQDEPLIRLKRMAELVLKHFHARRDFFQVIQREWSSMHPPQRDAMLKRRSSARALFAQVLREGQLSGVFRGVDADLAADGLMGIIRSFVRFGDPKLTPDELSAHLLDLFLYGVATPVPGSKESPCHER